MNIKQWTKKHFNLSSFLLKLMFKSFLTYLMFLILLVVSIIFFVVSSLKLESTSSHVKNNQLVETWLGFYWIVYGAILLLILVIKTIEYFKVEYENDTYALFTSLALSRTNNYCQKMFSLLVFYLTLILLTCIIPLLIFGGVSPSGVGSYLFHKIGYCFLALIIFYCCITNLTILLTYLLTSKAIWFLTSILMLTSVFSFVIPFAVFQNKGSNITGLTELYDSYNSNLENKKYLKQKINYQDFLYEAYLLFEGHYTFAPLIGNLGDDSLDSRIMWLHDPNYKISEITFTPTNEYQFLNISNKLLGTCQLTSKLLYCNDEFNIKWQSSDLQKLLDNMLFKISVDQIYPIAGLAANSNLLDKNNFNGFRNLFNLAMDNKNFNFKITTHQKGGENFTNASLHSLATKNSDIYDLLNSYYKIYPQDKVLSLTEIINIYLTRSGSFEFQHNILKNIMWSIINYTDSFKSELQNAVDPNGIKVAASLANILLNSFSKYGETLYLSGEIVNLINYIKIISDVVESQFIKLSPQTASEKELTYLTQYNKAMMIMNSLNVWGQWAMMFNHPGYILAPLTSINIQVQPGLVSSFSVPTINLSTGTVLKWNSSYWIIDSTKWQYYLNYVGLYLFYFLVSCCLFGINLWIYNRKNLN
ncbi:ABC transporter permease [Spiroplasma sp. DGKH1]|uniref:ABC transporter permease n=1 Tax=Spiroplasma sp. DGKH1 TaxID=3050074 RepID=UPI0034C659D7